MMEEQNNKELMIKLLEFLKNQILPAPENQWFAKELFKILAPTADARITDIHEHCIEKVMEQQANEFYKDFVIPDIRPQLVSDFIKMEHWRRRNNIQEFCMALYQQLEAIVNFICNNSAVKQIWKDIRGAYFSTDFKAKDIRVRWKDDKSKTIEEGIVYKPENYGKELNELYAMDKFKAVLYIFVYNTSVNLNNSNSFNYDFNTGHSIYEMRNLNHRGNIITEDQSKHITDILNNTTDSMCMLLGFFARFVSGINKYYPIKDDLNDFAKSCCK